MTLRPFLDNGWRRHALLESESSSGCLVWDGVIDSCGKFRTRCLRKTKPPTASSLKQDDINQSNRGLIWLQPLLSSSTAHAAQNTCITQLWRTGTLDNGALSRQ